MARIRFAPFSFTNLFTYTEIDKYYIVEFQCSEVHLRYNFYRDIDKHHKQTNSLYIRDV